MAILDGNPYQFHRKEIEGDHTLCETCDIVIKSKDWRSHSGGKKHRMNKQKNENELKANGHLAASNVVAAAQDYISTTTGPIVDLAGTLESSNYPNMTCHKCGEVGHISKDCFAGMECRKCHQMGHMAKNCPTSSATGGGFACHNCGSPDHKARDCPEPRVPTCHNCEQKGHMSKECPEPRVPKCKNCDERGHLARECPLPKDWSRVQCNNCQQMGHGSKRCPNPTVEAAAAGDWSNVDTTAASGSWDTGANSFGGDGFGTEIGDSSVNPVGEASWATGTPSNANEWDVPAVDNNQSW